MARQKTPTVCEEENIISLMKYKKPPFCLERDELGLICDGSVEYVYKENGRVDWRKMVNPSYLVPNKQLTSETDVSKLGDEQMLIKLGGIRELAHVRGFYSVGFSPVTASENFVSTVCTIGWISNYETRNNVSYSAQADASQESTRGFASNYLSAIAENRAFVRCVRNFLKIDIVGEEEVGNSEVASLDSNAPPKPLEIVRGLMTQKGVTFDHLKAILIEEKFANADKISKIEEISQIKLYDLIGRLEKFKKS